MNRDRPSIFTNPSDDPFEPTAARAPESPAAPAEAPRGPIRPRPPSEFEPPPPQDARDPRISRQAIVLGSMGLAILALGGFIAASLLRPGADPAAAAGPTASATSDLLASAEASPVATSKPTASPVPTPVPTPAGPPAEVAVGGWATVTVGELNVRSAAGEDARSVYRLVEGAVVNVADGPTAVAGANWYRVASLGGASGWVSSGWVAEPYLATLVDDPTLIRCAKVGRAVFDIVDGTPAPRDPLRIGDLAVPAAAFDDVSLGAIELMRGMGQEVCFSAQAGSDGLPNIRTELYAAACGHAVAEGDFFRLRPAAGDNASLSSQVKDPVVVHPSLLIGGPPDDRKSTNLRTIVSMMANEGGMGCINVSVVERDGKVTAHRTVDVQQCSIVTEYNRDSLKLTPASGGDLAWIKLTADGYQAGQFPLETPISVSVNASASDEMRAAYAWRYGEGGC